MTTISNNKLPEWRKALNSAVENYQSAQAWYEENRDSPAALDDMERAEDQLANFVRKCGFSIVLSLLDEIDELQERRKADSAEPACYALTNVAGEVYNTHSSAQNAGAYRDLIHQSDDSLTLRVTPLYAAPPTPVMPDDYQHLKNVQELYHAQEKRLFKIAKRIQGPAFDKYAHTPSQAIDVLEAAIFGENEESGHAAMLNGGKS
ncbi:TPA: hypothetical protein ACGEPX_004535 [Salmonella enterica]